MTKLVLVPTIATLTMLCVSCSRTPVAEVEEGPGPEERIAAADALDQAYLEAMNAGDADAVAAMYANDAVSFPPDMLIARSAAEIGSGLGAMFEQMPGVQMEIVESHQIPAGDMVIGWGLVKARIPGPDGSAEEMEMRYTDVKAERDGKWVYIHDHASAPLPPIE